MGRSDRHLRCAEPAYARAARAGACKVRCRRSRAHRQRPDPRTRGRRRRRRVRLPRRIHRPRDRPADRRRGRAGHRRNACRCWSRGVGRHPDAGGHARLRRNGRHLPGRGDHKAAGLPYLVYLRHPTTGGVFASWGSLGHVTVAEPGALIGFLGPKCSRHSTARRSRRGFRSRRTWWTRGSSTGSWRPRIWPPWWVGYCTCFARALACAQVCRSRSSGSAPSAAPPRRVTTWESVLLTRRADRPGVRELLALGADGRRPAQRYRRR